MEEKPNHWLREASGRPDEGSAENPREQLVEEGGEQRAEGGSERVRTASEIVAVVSAGVLAGGGTGMLGGVALGAINPFFVGIVGAAAGAVASVPLGRAILRRPEVPEAGEERRPWWRRVLGGERAGGRRGAP